MRIGLDVDGVLANFFAAYEDNIIKHTGKDLFGDQKYPHALPKVWDWPQTFGYTAEEISRVWRGIREDSSFYSSLQSLPGMKHAKNLDDSKHDLYFITDRSGREAQWETQEWLRFHGFTCPSVILSRVGKGDVVRALDLELYLDDKVENIIDVQLKAPKCRAYLTPLYPYNMKHSLFNLVNRVSDTVQTVLNYERLI